MRQPGLGQSGGHDALRTMEVTEDAPLRQKDQGNTYNPIAKQIQGSCVEEDVAMLSGSGVEGQAYGQGLQEDRSLLSIRKSLLTKVGWTPL